MKKGIFGIAVLACSLLFIPAGIAKADTSYTLLQPLPLGSSLGNEGASEVTSTTFSDYVTGGFKLGIGIAGALAVVMIIWGGFEYITTDIISKKGDGRKKINNAIIGLLLALASFLILQTINRSLVNFKGTILPPLPKSGK